MTELGMEARAAWAIARRQLRITMRYRLNAVNRVIQPIYQTLIPGILLGATFAVAGQAVGLGESAGTTDIAGYLFIGVLALMFTSAGFWDVAFAIKYEMDSGTLEPAWLTPTRRETFIIGLTLAGVILASISSALLVVIGMLLFGASMAPGLLIGAPALVVASVGVLGIGYLIGAVVLRMRDANFFVDAADFIFVVLSGAAFPILVLPDVLQWLAYLLPTTHALDLMRVSALGTKPLLPAAVQWTLLAATSLAFLLVGRQAWMATEHRLRVEGSLGQH